MRRRRRGFTLIELMIVVVIIAILSAVAIPAFLKFVRSSKGVSAQQRAAIAQAEKAQESDQEEAPAIAARAARPGVAPKLKALTGAIDLEAGHRLDGLRIHTWYEARFEGAYTFEAPPLGERVQLAFPFPVGSVGASDVMLRLRDADGALKEPEGVVYDLRGIYWAGGASTEGVIEAEVTYKAEGYNRFLIHLPGEGRTAALNLDLNIKGVEAPRIPSDALQPTTQAPGRFSWAFENLVTDTRVIRVELPAVLSPIGRVILLAKLASVGVFLFGIGFWYVSEGREPGRLDSFRWGHFLLLSLTYFLFFVIFAVLMFRYQLSAPLGLTISAAFSLPLLTLHVTHNLGGKLGLDFALTRVLPLAVLTLLLVINGVYGGAYREYIYLGALIFTLAYLTLSYRGWTSGRQAWRASKEWSARHQRQRNSLEAELELLKEATSGAAALLRRVEEALSVEDTPELAPKRAELEARAAALSAARSACDLEAHAEALAAFAALTEAKRPSGERSSGLFGELERTRRALEPLQREADLALTTLLEARAEDTSGRAAAREARARRVEARLEETRAACAWAGEVDMEAEGALYGDLDASLAAVASAVEARRAALSEALEGEADLLARRRALAAETDDEAHLKAAVDLERDAARFTRRLKIVGEALRAAAMTAATARQRHQVSVERAQAAVAARHCTRCGARMGEGAAYCGGCGAHQPELRCGACEAVYPLPAHLMGLWPVGGEVRCPACGAGVALPEAWGMEAST